MAPVVPMLMNVDNQAAINKIEGEAYSIKAKHIDVRHKYLCNLARRGIVTRSTPNPSWIVDMLTKTLDAT